MGSVGEICRVEGNELRIYIFFLSSLDSDSCFSLASPGVVKVNIPS